MRSPRSFGWALALVGLMVAAGVLEACAGGAGSRPDGSASTGAVVRTRASVPVARGAGISRPSGVQLTVGRSVDGRPIRAYVVGGVDARRSVLVVGCVHGNEPAGEAITARLRHQVPPTGVALWVVEEFNPDGCHAHTRQNAHGVDLNRNSPWHWRPLDRLGGLFYSGPAPLSEPESRAIHRLVLRLRPAVSIWYHQHAALVDDGSGGSIELERRYANLVGLPLINFGLYPGSITGWQNATFPHDTAFVVELPAGAMSTTAVNRHVAAVLALARAVGRG